VKRRITVPGWILIACLAAWLAALIMFVIAVVDTFMA
jgi:hypothetical protein